MNIIQAKIPVYLDFETYMDKSKRYSLNDLSDIQYINDPRFQVLSVAIKIEGKCTVYPGNTKAWRNQVDALNDDGHIFIAHNARFDFRILSMRFGINPLWMSDTMLIARYLGYPKCNLAELASRLLGDKKLELGTDSRRLETLTPNEWRDLARYNAKDIDLTEKIYELLAPRLPPMELSLVDQTLKLCLKQNTLDWARVAEIIVSLESDLIKFKQNDLEIFENRYRPVWLRKHIYESTGADPGTVDKKRVVLSELPMATQTVLKTIWEIKEIEKEKGNLESLSNRMTSGANTAAHIDLNYSKAVTHRWSSGGEDTQSFNMQNMGRESDTRTIWIPSADCVYVIVDLSQIEARVAAWYAGERALLEAFTNKKCVYCNFGQYVFGHVLDKATEKSERQLCKQAVLGLQFGMGVDRFYSVLQTQAQDQLQRATLRLGNKNDRDTAQQIVKTYRRAYPGIHKIPGALNSILRSMVTQSNGPIHRVGPGGKFSMDFDSVDRVLSVRLPSGSRIHYRDILTSMGVSKSGYSELQISYAGLGGRKKTFSYSMPFENVVQATARDIMAYQLLESERQGFDLRFHTHDEAVFQIPKKYFRKRKLAIEKIFETTPPELLGLPVSCEAFLSDRYTKDEAYMKGFADRLSSEMGRSYE